MARARLIFASISFSETVDKMTEWAQLAYTFSIAHRDDFGILPGSPAKLKAITKPLSARQPTDFAAAVAEWIDAGSDEAYLAEDGRVYLRAINFDVYQTGLHKRTRSRFPTSGRPLTATEYLAAVAGKFPELPAPVVDIPRTENRTEQREENENENEKESSPPSGDLDANRFHESSVAFQLSALLLTLIRERDPSCVVDLQKWSRHVDLLMRRDGRSSADVERIIRWAHTDEFWRDNILSTQKLRKHFSQLYLKAATPLPSTGQKTHGADHATLITHFAGR